MSETRDLTGHATATRGFASDNYAGAHPEVIEAVIAANTAHVPAYGDDPYTAQLRKIIAGHFGEQAEVFPVFNGTGANVTALAASIPSWGAVICADTAHIHTDEGSAPEKSAGIKLLPVATTDAKISAADVAGFAAAIGDVHFPQPHAVSITQTTELGTCYQIDEIREISKIAHAHNMVVHMDGARVANAAATLGADLREFTTDAGIDILSLGGTKNGALGAEAIVAIQPDRVPGLKHVRKHQMQLASKMRFISAQLTALYGTDLWLRSAQHANAMATRLRDGIDALGSPEIFATQATQANGVFATMPPEVAERARERFHFYDWPHGENEVRLMCSFDTTESDVDELLSLIAPQK